MSAYELPPDGHYHTDISFFILFALKGKPDTKGWRDYFKEMGESTHCREDWRPISYEGRIYPLWALRDYWYLRKKDPYWEKRFLEKGIDFSPLEDLEK